MTVDRAGHLPVNGLELYYEVHGDLGAARSPLLVIPGAFMACDSMEAWTTAFARDRAVIVFDQQGHGRTPDTSRPLSYEQFGDDAAALLRVAALLSLASAIPRADEQSQVERDPLDARLLAGPGDQSGPSSRRRLGPDWSCCV